MSEYFMLKNALIIKTVILLRNNSFVFTRDIGTAWRANNATKLDFVIVPIIDTNYRLFDTIPDTFSFIRPCYLMLGLQLQALPLLLSCDFSL